MSRSLKKGPFVDPRLMEKMAKIRKEDRTIIKTWSRDCSITPEMVGYIFGVHNGRDFVTVSVTEDMVGHKLGEFSSSTIFKRHGGKMQRDIEQAAEQKEGEKVAEAAAKPAAKKPAK